MLSNIEAISSWFKFLVIEIPCYDFSLLTFTYMYVYIFTILEVKERIK